ncbi:MAG: nitrogenase component 1 [Bacilli bacterium]|nr:nitrogenase component 1 [Bacilli bacterium]
MVINPAKICQPIGAILAYKGIHNCMPITHGSQGCSSYLRMMLARHYREPTLAATSSFTEDSVVFGGRNNLKEAVDNVINVYHPDVLAINTTCSSETIGDDVHNFMEEIKEEEFFDPKVRVVIANTPSYVGSHITGYDNAVKAIAQSFPRKGKPNGKLNIIPGFVDPGDIREIKRILGMMGVRHIVFPDTTDVFDAPLPPESGGLYPPGGTPIPDLVDAANSRATIALGRTAGAAGAVVLKGKFQIPNVDFGGMTDFMLPFPAPVDYEGSYDRSFASYLDLQVGKDIKALHFDLGIQGCRSSYYERETVELYPEYIDTLKYSVKQYNAGLAISGYYKITNGFNLGLSYYPSCFAWQNGKFDLHYSHLIMLELIFKIKAYRPRK